MSAKRERAAFDVVGKYDQDQINGFSPKLLERFIEIIDPENAKSVFELMGGDGNLTERMYQFCLKNNISAPKTRFLEYSQVQTEFAKYKLKDAGTEVFWGDVLERTDFKDGTPIKCAGSDRVVIKSANHEIPYHRQLHLYQSAYEFLNPNGLFVNLGFVFDSEGERDEMREIARCKDSLAGMDQAVKNRHFLTRSELETFLTQAGFVDIQSVETFNYAIHSTIVAKQYFGSEVRESYDSQFQAVQAQCLELRRNGRVKFDGATSTMYLPGEITVARRPSRSEENTKIFREYPYDYLRDIEAHRELLAAAEKSVPRGAKVFDVGCGIGLFAERVLDKVQEYRGIDLSDESVAICQTRLGGTPHATFKTESMNEADYGSERWDAITLINSLYVEGVHPFEVLGKAYDGLAKGGVIVVSGPISKESYRNAEPQILAQLESDGVLKSVPSLAENLRRANSRLLTQRARYWSPEGMIALLREVGFEEFLECSQSFYYGQAFFVVARK